MKRERILRLGPDHYLHSNTSLAHMATIIYLAKIFSCLYYIVYIDYISPINEHHSLKICQLVYGAIRFVEYMHLAIILRPKDGTLEPDVIVDV